MVYETCWSMLCWTGGPSWLSHTNLSRVGDQRVGKVAGRPDKVATIRIMSGISGVVTGGHTTGISRPSTAVPGRII